TRAIQFKAQQLQDEFRKWVWDDLRVSALATHYNRRFKLIAHGLTGERSKVCLEPASPSHLVPVQWAVLGGVGAIGGVQLLPLLVQVRCALGLGRFGLQKVGAPVHVVRSGLADLAAVPAGTANCSRMAFLTTWNRPG